MTGVLLHLERNFPQLLTCKHTPITKYINMPCLHKGTTAEACCKFIPLGVNMALIKCMGNYTEKYLYENCCNF